jgi:hypothetical protein
MLKFHQNQKKKNNRGLPLKRSLYCVMAAISAAAHNRASWLRHQSVAVQLLFSFFVNAGKAWLVSVSVFAKRNRLATAPRCRHMSLVPRASKSEIAWGQQMQ